ncbi:MAG: NUDIX domain-containing protein [Rhizobiaceae bacterium]|nr:NUDIX domain-containing protein [Rhizobiaceae bacterium]
MSSPQIRVVALAIICHPRTGGLLVFESRDDSRGLTYHRPLGGGVEFGETAAEAVVRELREEIGVPIEPIRMLGATESIFEVRHALRHEVALLIECRFADERDYDRELFIDIEGHGEHGFWREAGSQTPLFPEALPEILKGLA